MEQVNCATIVLCADAESSGHLRPALQASGFEISEASNDLETLEAVAEVSPAAVLLDLDHGTMSGYLVCKLLREQYGELLPIVFLSGEKSGAEDRVAGLLLGADDYLVKPFHTSEVVARIRRLVARSAKPLPRMEEQVEQRDDFDLTKREQEILAMLLEGLTQSEIAATLVISSNTVATHIQRVLLKLGVHNRTQAVAKAARAGWLARSSTSQQGSHRTRLDADASVPSPLRA